MPAALNAVAEQHLQLLQRRRGKFYRTSEPCSNWLEQPATIWGELVKATPLQSLQPESMLTNDMTAALSAIRSQQLGVRDAQRPASCPGGSGGTSGAKSARAQRPGSTGGRSPFESVRGLEVYCTSMELAVNKKLRRHHSSSGRKEPNSAGGRRSSSGSSASSEQIDSLPAWVPPSKVTGRGSRPSSSGGGPQGADPVDAASGLMGSDTGRAVGLALSLRERVLQLERRNRALMKKLKSLEDEKTQQTQHSSNGPAVSAVPQQQQRQQQEQEQQQEQLAVQPKSLHQLQVVVLPIGGVAAQATDSGDGSDTDLLAPATPTTPGAGMAASQGINSCAEDGQVLVDILPAADCEEKQQQQQQQPVACTDDTSSRQWQEQQEAEVVTMHPGIELVPPRTPELPITSSSSAEALARIEQPLAEAQEQRYQQTIASLQHQLGHVQMLHGLLQNDYADLEFVLKETERQRREYAARYAFVVIDSDGDGYISVEQVESYELFACYAPQLLRAAFAMWRWQSGFPGYLNIEDFVRFVEFAEDRSSLQAQRFWFGVLDSDGDGRLSWQDMKVAYDAVDKSSARFVVAFEDLINQIRDMVKQQKDPQRGFTCAELRASKLGAGVLGLLTNHNNMLLQRSTAEWGRGEYPL